MEATLIDWPPNETRIDIIGQNGPTGEHYEYHLCIDPAWHIYSSTSERQCSICRRVEKWTGDSWQVEHKRTSKI